LQKFLPPPRRSMRGSKNSSISSQILIESISDHELMNEADEIIEKSNSEIR
jgi:hypothetical protein